MKKIEHIGIAVKNLEEANQTYKMLLDAEAYKQEEVTSEGVITSFFKVGESKIELLAATKPDSPINKFLEKKGEGIHHLAFAVDNIEKEIKRLEAEGFQLISKNPKPGADNKIIAFLHPKSANGVLVELCQEKNE
ncbi:methylmalonyl-CoA epimerase [Haloflavibacter putidus]|uniref:Methylmalonyl-CoA epimerase n=1 Tax=Haloflavibacter putidus TaxID=2576776 RepID=A0A508A169_9FLAO|nr:methylmalonyl-CoA epimerase [Haloflavibacter putidus]TQD40685.1 methylmalonyl-CoA epimerase [Haloflavibacter putidus]